MPSKRKVQRILEEAVGVMKDNPALPALQERLLLQLIGNSKDPKERQQLGEDLAAFQSSEAYKVYQEWVEAQKRVQH